MIQNVCEWQDFVSHEQSEAVFFSEFVQGRDILTIWPLIKVIQSR